MMAEEPLIPADEFCLHHSIEISFLSSLQDHGLIEMVFVEGARYLHNEQLGDLERLVRLHHDLHINLEGIEAVKHLLEQMESMQQEMMFLKNRLRLYEH